MSSAMASETNLRKRVTFSYDDKEDDDRILDEQGQRRHTTVLKSRTDRGTCSLEQEELIQQLKEKSVKQSSQYKRQLQLIVGLSLAL